jgi:hypothetical protein
VLREQSLEMGGWAFSPLFACCQRRGGAWVSTMLSLPPHCNLKSSMLSHSQKSTFGCSGECTVARDGQSGAQDHPSTIEMNISLTQALTMGYYLCSNPQ